MSDPKLISPMLDNFQMGGPISDHDGVCCCPAMRKNSDEKYIVKVISIPASQTKLDALLLTGAYTDKSAALVYFRQLAKGIVDEKETLDNLAKLEGFVPFDNCQIVPKDDESGYEVYLISPYRKTLERHLSRHTMTQLSAVNLGLDLCAALSVCRQSGYLCVDLKPSNIYIIGDKDYKIGDLGFVKLKGLKYASLPDMYRSCYTAPELEDAFAVLNDRIDIYAVGLILYQIFNDGKLPFSGNVAPSEKFEAPLFADEEIAAIILKACDPDPAARWEDPVQMGQAIVNYMQKNGVNDTPLTAEFFGDPEENESEESEDTSIQVSTEDVSEFETEAVNSIEDNESFIEIEDEVILEGVTEDLDEPQTEVEDIDSIIAAVDKLVETTEIDVDSFDEAEIVETVELPIEVEEDICTNEVSETETTEEIVEEFNEEANDEAIEEVSDDAIEDVADEEIETEVCADDCNQQGESSADEEEEYDNLSFLEDWDPDSDQLLSDMATEFDGISDEISDIIEQIDALTAEPVPSLADIPDPVVVDEANESDDEVNNIDEALIDDDANLQEDFLDEDQPYVPKKKRTGLIWCIVLIIITALATGAYFFYTQYYLQPIHTLELTGAEDKLQVALTADIDESLLSVVCADSHGDKITAPVVGGIASFSGLTPDSAYTITVEVDGLHQLVGMTSKVYSTPLQTKVMQLSAITGSEDGSVILSFAVEGPDSDQWNVVYSADDEGERTTAFPAHMVTLTGLTVGKEYTLRIEPVDEIYLAGETEISYVAQNLVTAENLQIISCVNGELTAQWDAPEGELVEEWTVRCYNESGYDETLTTSDTTITFQNVDDSVENTVEVTAANMSVSQRVLVSANSVTVSDFTVDTSIAGILNVSWNANREIPENGWSVRYSVNGISAPSVITTTENHVEIPVVPNGNYNFTIMDDAGNSVLGGPFSYEHGSASDFVGYAVSKDYITTRLCKTPAASSWSYMDLNESDYVNTFSVGDKISAVLTLSHWYEISDDSIMTTFAIYDETDTLVNFSHFDQTWKFLWYQNYCELDITSIPSEIGTYEVFVYFNGAEVGSQKFEITA